MLLGVLRRIEEQGVLEAAHRTMENCGQIFHYASVFLANTGLRLHILLEFTLSDVSLLEYEHAIAFIECMSEAIIDALNIG